MAPLGPLPFQGRAQAPRCRHPKLKVDPPLYRVDRSEATAVRASRRQVAAAAVEGSVLASTRGTGKAALHLYKDNPKPPVPEGQCRSPSIYQAKAARRPFYRP